MGIKVKKLLFQVCSSGSATVLVLSTMTNLTTKLKLMKPTLAVRPKIRHVDKRTANAQGRSLKDKTPVMGMIERGGKIIAKHVEDVKIDTLTPEVIKHVKTTAMVFTDEWWGYNQLNRVYDHLIVKHNQGEYVNGRIHTNTIEGFWSLLKRMIIGTYHFTSRKHLQKYVDEMVFRYNLRNESMQLRFNEMLLNTENRLTYKELIG